MIGNLRFWCQKVLPLVYDDSLSYYELLCKVVGKLNEVINTVNLSEESVYSDVKAIMDEWYSSGKIADLIEDERLTELAISAIVGDTVGVEQVFSTAYPYPSSSGARMDVVPSGTDAYYYQGFAVTPNGFAMVRLAPESNKANANDISQIFEFSKTGTYLRSAGVNVHHGNGMVYYDGYLYVDVGSNIAKVKYTDLTIESYINMGGSCPALDRENGVIYSVASSSRKLYSYNIATGVIDSVTIEANAPYVYNGGFYKDGIFYGITYSNDFIMLDVKTGKFLGGKTMPATDSTGIYIVEAEDCDVDEDGNVYVLSQQAHFTSTLRDVHGNSLRLRNVGFYLGKVYLNGGASSTVSKPLRLHPAVYVTSPATLTEAMNAKKMTGAEGQPFNSLAVASFLDSQPRSVHCENYTKLWFGDIYQPVGEGSFGVMYNLIVDTDYPLVIKGWDGYIQGASIKITNYGISVIYCNRVYSLDIDVSDLSDGDYVGVLLYSNLDIVPHSSGSMPKVYMYAGYATLNGGNVIPVGAVGTDHYKCTSQTGTEGETVTIVAPIIGGTRGMRLGLSNATTYEIFRLYSTTKLVGTNGTIINMTTPYDNSTGTLTFVAPFTFSAFEVF